MTHDAAVQSVSKHVPLLSTSLLFISLSVLLNKTAPPCRHEHRVQIGIKAVIAGNSREGLAEDGHN